jgi:hypothetical protein
MRLRKLDPTQTALPSALIPCCDQYSVFWISGGADSESSELR